MKWDGFTKRQLGWAGFFSLTRSIELVKTSGAQVTGCREGVGPTEQDDSKERRTARETTAGEGNMPKVRREQAPGDQGKMRMVFLRGEGLVWMIIVARQMASNSQDNGKTWL